MFLQKVAGTNNIKVCFFFLPYSLFALSGDHKEWFIFFISIAESSFATFGEDHRGCVIVQLVGPGVPFQYHQGPENGVLSIC